MSANVRYYQFLADQANKLNEMRRRQQSSIGNMFSNMSLGRMLGVAGGTLLGATMGMPLLGMAVAGGLGGRAGSELGKKFSNVDLVGDVKAYKQDAADARAEGTDALRQLNVKANVNMLTDAFSVYTLGKHFPKAAEGVAEWGADKSKFLGDWGARNLGIGGDQFGKEVTAKALTDNPFLAQTQGLTEDKINDMFWNEWNPLDQAVQKSVVPAANNPSALVKHHIQNPTVLTPTPPPVQGPPKPGVSSGNVMSNIMNQKPQTGFNDTLLSRINATGADLTSGTTLTPNTIDFNNPYTLSPIYQNQNQNPYSSILNINGGW
jgi:hypothetical protein